MIRTPEVVVESVAARTGSGEPLSVLALGAADDLFSRGGSAARRDEIGAVVAATFSNPERFPPLSVRAAAHLGLGPVPALDLQMACSAYPYALYVAGRLASDTGKKVLVLDGDVQTPLVDKSDHATGSIFSDAATATVVSCDARGDGFSCFDFYSRYDEALACPAEGPMRMDGFKVFSFVATEVSKWLKSFIVEAAASDVAAFLPHNANPYMVRQLARSLGMSDRLVTADDALLNTGSSSIPLALAMRRVPSGRLLLAAFGAGFSASACTVSHKG